jgi:RimJ/RimL family protein N-acetyltransferase
MYLRSARTYIRPWKRQDDDLADEWPPYNDPLEPLWNIPRPFSFTTQDWYNGLDTLATRRTWAVEDTKGNLIGRISLREIDQGNHQSRLGITFGSPYVGQHLGTEALTVFMSYYFLKLGFDTMVLDVAGPNERAVRCYQRLGFTTLGYDWRDAGSLFDQRILDDPRYMHLRHFFQPGARGVQVQFLEMRLLKQDWLYRQHEQAKAN